MVANLLMLLLFLRAVVASVVLLATSVLSLGATLGVTSLVFEMAAPGQGLTFYVPFAAAVLLLAFASDYNIFTVGHVWEDAEGRTLRAAVRHALPSSVSAVVTAGLALGTSFAVLFLVPLAPFRSWRSRSRSGSPWRSWWCGCWWCRRCSPCSARAPPGRTAASARAGAPTAPRPDR